MSRRLLLKILGVTPLAPLTISDLVRAPTPTPPLKITGGPTDTIRWDDPVRTLDDLPRTVECGTGIFVEDCGQVYISTEYGWVIFSS